MAGTPPSLTSTTSPSSSTSKANATATENKAPKPLGFSKMNQVVTILVKGTSSTEVFIVHKEFACHYSPVFKSAFSSAFTEGLTQKHQLEDTSVEAVQLLVQWFYQQKLDLSWLSDVMNSVEISIHLVKLWVLADKLLIPRLQNEALRRLHEQPITATHCLNYVYENITPGAQLRRYFIDRCACCLECTWFTKYPEQFPREVLTELALCTTQALESGLDRKKMRQEFKLSDYYVSLS